MNTPLTAIDTKTKNTQHTQHTLQQYHQIRQPNNKQINPLQKIEKTISSPISNNQKTKLKTSNKKQTHNTHSNTTQPKEQTDKYKQKLIQPHNTTLIFTSNQQKLQPPTVYKKLL